MDRKAVWILAAAVLAVAAITLSAATLESTTGSSGFGIGGSGEGLESEDPDREPSDIGSGPEDSGIGQEPGFPLELELPCFRLLVHPLVVAGLLAILLAIGVVVTWRHNPGVGAAIVILLFLAALPFYIFLTACVSFDLQRDFPFPSGGGVAEGVGGGASLPDVTGSVTDPSVPEVLVLALGAILVVTLVTWWLSGDRDLPGSETVAEDGASTSPEPDVGAVGRAAGRAADRLETGDEFENDVYRAWAEMTSELDVEHPRSSTPSEFAMAAVEAGMNRNDVDRLTNLFEEVRYGGFDPTSKREREAIDTLRRIEDQYAGVDAETTGSSP